MANNDKNRIDMAAESGADGATAAGASTIGDAKGARTAGSKALLVMAILLVVVVLVMFMVKFARSHIGKGDGNGPQTSAQPASQSPTSNSPLVLPSLGGGPAAPASAAKPAAAIVPTPPQPTNVTVNGKQELTPAQKLMQQRLGSGFTGDDNGSPGTSSAASPVAAAAHAVQTHGPAHGGQGGASFAQLLRPVKLQAESAGRIGSENFMMLKGTMIPCLLVNRIDTSLPGMVSCDTTSNVYSANGKTVLLDRGTRLTGSYRNGLNYGQERVFIAWDRAVTPQGVVIELGSPSTDQLGAAGNGGKVVTHFWKKFGAAMLLSLVQDATQIGAASAGGNGTNAIVFGNTGQQSQQIANTALEHDINIPPTLLKPNGSRISVYVARDLDFSAIYGLKPVQDVQATGNGNG